MVPTAQFFSPSTKQFSIADAKDWQNWQAQNIKQVYGTEMDLQYFV